MEASPIIVIKCYQKVCNKEHIARAEERFRKASAENIDPREFKSKGRPRIGERTSGKVGNFTRSKKSPASPNLCIFCQDPQSNDDLHVVCSAKTRREFEEVIRSQGTDQERINLVTFKHIYYYNTCRLSRIENILRKKNDVSPACAHSEFVAPQSTSQQDNMQRAHSPPRMETPSSHNVLYSFVKRH
jgi:hypothetical protein